MTTDDVEKLETMSADPEEIEYLTEALKRYRKERGEKTPEAPNLVMENTQLKEESETLWERTKEAVKKSFDFLVVKPAEWIGHQLVDHPFRNILIALAAFALWYYSAPLAAGLSGISEKGLTLNSALLKESLSVDPSQLLTYDQFFKVGKAVGGAAAGIPNM